MLVGIADCELYESVTPGWLTGENRFGATRTYEEPSVYDRLKSVFVNAWTVRLESDWFSPT